VPLQTYRLPPLFRLRAPSDTAWWRTHNRTCDQVSNPRLPVCESDVLTIVPPSHVCTVVYTESLNNNETSSTDCLFIVRLLCSVIAVTSTSWRTCVIYIYTTGWGDLRCCRGWEASQFTTQWRIQHPALTVFLNTVHSANCSLPANYSMHHFIQQISS